MPYAACGEPSDAPYPKAVLRSRPYAHWRLCQYDSPSEPAFSDVTGHHVPLAAARAGAVRPKSPSDPRERDRLLPLQNEVNPFLQIDSSYLIAPSRSGDYAALSRLGDRGPFTIEAWVRPNRSYGRDLPCGDPVPAPNNCGFVLPVAGVGGSWQLGWAGTAAARGREGSWVHDQTPGPSIGANGWTFTIYDGYDCHGQPDCLPDNRHYQTAHRLQTTMPIEAGTWYYLVATYDGDTMSLYLNGTKLAEKQIGTLGAVYTPSGFFRLGTASDEEGQGNEGVSDSCNCTVLDGALDEVAYYTRALSADEIYAHYEAARVDPLTSPMGPPSVYRDGVADDAPYIWFPFDEHHVEPTSRATCYPCQSFERTTQESAGQIFTPARAVRGPSFPLGRNDTGIQFNAGGHVSTTRGPRFPLPADLQDISIETWIKTTPDTPATQAFFAMPTCSGCVGMVGLRLNQGKLELRADYDGFPNGSWQSLGGKDLDDGRWHHVLVVRDLTGSGRWRAFVDGADTGVTRETSSTSLLRGNYFSVGEVNSHLEMPRGGPVALDEFALYTRALRSSRTGYQDALERYKPILKYEGGEKFHVLSAAAMTDFYIPGWGLETSNSLKGSTASDGGGDPAPFAAANPDLANIPGSNPLDHLTLDYLGPTYPVAPSNPSLRAGTPALDTDFLSARGNASDNVYANDSDAMEDRQGYGRKVYARVAHTDDGTVWLQYWFFYYFNPSNTGASIGAHEGDWEMVQIRLDRNLRPVETAYAQHTTGQRCPWDAVEKIGDRPVVYVAESSHASYYGPDRIPSFPDPALRFLDHADGRGGTLDTAELVRIQDATPPRWLQWPGRWGDSHRDAPVLEGLEADSPHGPASKDAAKSLTAAHPPLAPLRAAVCGLLLAAALTLVGAGCGSDKERAAVGTSSTTGGTRPAGAAPGPPAAAADASEAAQAAGQSVQTVAQSGRTVTLSDGTVVTLPPKPRRTSLAPQRSCRKRTYRTSRGRRAVYFPPRPGIAAERTDERTVTVRYRFYRFDRRCKPHIVDLTVRDADDASFPATDEQVEVHALRGTVRIALPDRVLGADTVAVRAYTHRGLPSASGIVRIRDLRRR